MTHEMRLERSIDASPEVVFDAFTDPALQKELHGAGDLDLRDGPAGSGTRH